MNVVGLAGPAGAGKSAVADILVREHGMVAVAFADPMKRFAQELFDWGNDRLWGSSALRNEPDPDWGGLSARHALQQLGADWGRACAQDVWVRYALRTAQSILEGRCEYSPQSGVSKVSGVSWRAGVVIPDVRFDNEARHLREVGGVVLLIARDGAGLHGAAGEHESERGVSKDLIDGTVFNDGPLEELHERVLAAISTARGKREKGAGMT